MRFWEVPEEFEAVDYTKQEDIQELVKGPDAGWGVPVQHQGRPHHGGEEKAPPKETTLMDEARKLHDGPVLGPLADASDDLYAWAATRVASEPHLTLESLLEEMQLYGVADLAAEAAELMERQGTGEKAGEVPRLVVRDTLWADGEPGQGGFELDGQLWRTWDYQEEISLDEEAAALLGITEGVEEKRQCVTKTMAVGTLWRRLARRPQLTEVNEEALSLRKEQLQHALEASAQMGQAAEYVTPVEHELRVYIHDVINPHHERDFRSFAVLPVQDLEEARVVVLRADVRGRLLVEVIVGNAWKQGQWTMFAFIWKGHMVYAQPPEELNVDEWLASTDPHVTPNLGFQFFWHARHDQAVSAPGRVACRHCKPGRKAGDNPSTCRPRSHLAALALVAGSSEPAEEKVIRTTPEGGLMLRELFAGHATLTDAWRAKGGRALEPIEVWEFPHQKTGYRKEHDLTRPEVQGVHLQRAKHGPENVTWIASPCTSYCDWNLQNGGSRTWEHPEGGHGRPLTDSEALGNTLSEFGATYFETMLDSGGFPIAESSGCSGRYPKQWNLPCWQRILKRSDVEWMDFKMCAFGLGPPDNDKEFYQHLTRVVFPIHSGLRALLARRCPGVGPNHLHVALKGARPGSAVSRCTEAGVYCSDFVNSVCTILLDSLVGGVSQPSSGLVLKTSQDGDKAGGDADSDEEQMLPATEHTVPNFRIGPDMPPGAVIQRLLCSQIGQPGQEAEEATEEEVSPDGEKVSVEARPSETQEEIPSSPEVVHESHFGQVCRSGIQRILHEVGMAPEPPSGTTAYTATTEGEMAQKLLEDDPQFAFVAMRGFLYSPPMLLPDQRGVWQMSRTNDHLVVYHLQPRRAGYVPGYPGLRFDTSLLRSERLTVCFRSHGTDREVHTKIPQNWRQVGTADLHVGWWKGYSVFVIKGHPLPWEREIPDRLPGPGTPEVPWEFDAERATIPSVEGGESEPPVSESEEEDRERDRSRSPPRAGSSEGEAHRCSKTRCLAENYVETIKGLKEGSPEGWARVLRAGDHLLQVAGSVEDAARALWEVREGTDLDNLKGITNPDLAKILHPLMLEYLVNVKENGMVARHPGSEERQEGNLHPNAKRHLGQVYKQIWKDVRKHRVLVVQKSNPNLEGVVSSPFEAVDKMNPDRSISADKRVVHDQRRVNVGTDKTWHPPALQPTHEQIARRVLWHKARFPGVRVVIAKKDVSGAFRLLWVAPQDAPLFAGDLPWNEAEMDQADGEQEQSEEKGSDMTVIYLVSSFGFSGSPGEWTVWGRATEEYHRAHRPGDSRRDGSAGFDCKILVDDAILVEPVIGLRPWVSADCYEKGVKMMLGKEAVNAEKDAIEGAFKTEQVIWGLTMNTETEQVSLPERRILKGAHLLADPAFDVGSKTLCLRQLQQFRGIATGWAVVVRGLRNELKAADLFLTNGDGALVIKPKATGYSNEESASKMAWEDLWSLFEVCRWLCSRTGQWSSQFCATLQELLDARERLNLPGGHKEAVFVSADATPTTVGAIDWTNGMVSRLTAADFGPWLAEVFEAEAEEGKVRIHLTEMLALVAFGATQGEAWRGKVVIYAGDNQVVRAWVAKRQSASRAGRILVRVLAMCEMRYGFQVVAGWWRTFHNVDSDYITRCSEAEFVEFVNKKGWEVVDMKEVMEQAILDSQRFGVCFLSWRDPEDRKMIMQLKEQRMARAVDKQLNIDWAEIYVAEWAAQDRVVLDFETVARACGCSVRPEEKKCIAVGTLGCDVTGKQVKQFLRFIKEKEAQVAVAEGPALVAWECFTAWATLEGWACYFLDFVTTECGEALARKRRACLLCEKGDAEVNVEDYFVRAVVAKPLECGKVASELAWKKPWKIELAIGIPRDPLLPHVVGHWWPNESSARTNLHGLTGPGRWPQALSRSEMETLVVWDRQGPVDHLRPLSIEEVWQLQGRSLEELRTVTEHLQGDKTKAGFEGSRATGMQTAEMLLGLAGAILEESEGKKAGAVRDGPKDEALARLLLWLRRWKQKEFGTEGISRKAGGKGMMLVSRKAEAMWLEVLEEEEETGGDWKAGGRASRSRRNAVQAQAEASLVVDPQGDTFDGNVAGKIEDWLEANMVGDKAESTARIYRGMWQKWVAWARRQGWETEYLDPKGDKLDNENKLLGFLGYLGWLGSGSATIKQAVFAVKDAHKRAGAGDPTEGMFRLWLLVNAMDRRADRKPRRLGVTPGMLVWIGTEFENMGQKRGEVKIDAVMLQAALLTGWYFMMRASEFCESGPGNYDMILRGVDVKLTKDGIEAGLGDANEVTVQFRKTKSDQEAFGSCKTMGATGVAKLCPVKALDEYRCAVPGRFRGPEAERALFRWGNGAILKRTEVQYILQKAATAVGLPAERFMSHSLRIGGASALYQATADVEFVKRMGRWSSSAVQRYLHDGGHVLKELAGKMAKVD